jgi:RNA polymerase sigma factor (sigma-70 family)
VKTLKQTGADTRIGGASAKFPVTRRSAVLASCSPDPDERKQALEKIGSAYWKPVYKFIRMRWTLSNEDAKDLTQAFFARAIEKEYFKAYRSAKGSFRTFVRTCVAHFVVNESKYAKRLKRGGAADRISLEETEEPAVANLEEVFEKEWIRNLFELALEDLREMCVSRDKACHFQIFERYDLQHTDVSYSDLAVEFDIAVTDVTNYLAWCRREFRRLIMERIRQVTANDEEFRREVRVVLGKNA